LQASHPPSFRGEKAKLRRGGRRKLFYFVVRVRDVKLASTVIPSFVFLMAQISGFEMTACFDLAALMRHPLATSS
jgi:hypothetical protein